MRVMKKPVLIMAAAVMIASLTACGSTANTQAPSNSAQAEMNQAGPFHKFQGKDFDGNVVDESLFSKNDATLLNFWFNGCSACVNEMPALEKFNGRLREKGAELVGVNVLAGESQEVFDEAKEILSKQGATYRNIIIDEDQEARNYIAKIFSFPTTIIVDKNGNIVGQPILGSLEDDKKLEQILKVIDDLKAGKDISGETISDDSTGDKLQALLTEENDIFYEHKEVWEKLFAKISKDKAEESKQMPYLDFLKSQVEELKGLFSEDELNVINSDLKKIEKIEMQIDELGKE
ncbi:MAG: redoxin domain-containing protein [Stomatobaculum sp.]